MTPALVSAVARSLPAFIFLVAAIFVWETATRLFHVPEWLLPAPHVVASSFVRDWGSWVRDTGITMEESVLGFLTGSLLGIGVGILFTHSRPLERALYPYVIALKTIPLVALAPILAVWFSNHLVSNTIMGAVVTFFPCVVNTIMGLRSPSDETVDLMRSLSASRAQIFWKLRFPAALPGIFAALKITATLAVIGAIVAEMTAPVSGLGCRLQLAEERTDMVGMVIAVILASLAGIVFFQFIVLLERRFLYWLPRSATWEA